MRVTSPSVYFRTAPDHDLIVACQNGQEAAWDVLVDRYEQLVYTMIDRYMLEWPEESEVFQAVWLSLLHNLDQMRRTNRIGVWLAAATRSELRRRRRREKNRNGNGSEPAINKWGSIDQDDQELEDIVSRYGRYQAACQTVERLDPASQKLQKMLYQEPAAPTDVEIAAKPNDPVDIVEQLQMRILKKLRRVIADFT